MGLKRRVWIQISGAHIGARVGRCLSASHQCEEPEGPRNVPDHALARDVVLLREQSRIILRERESGIPRPIARPTSTDNFLCEQDEMFLRGRVRRR
jgi:hypothetical protein